MKHASLTSVTAALTAIVLALTNPTAEAQVSDTWSATPADALWSNTGNWVGSTIPGPTPGDIATFNGASTFTLIDLGITRTSGGIDFGGATPYTIGLTGADTLTLPLTWDNAGGNDADVRILTGTTANMTIAADIVLGDGDGTTGFTDQNDFSNVTTATSATLVITGDISTGTGGAGAGGGENHRINFTGGDAHDLQGDINETLSTTSVDSLQLFVISGSELDYSGTFNPNATTPLNNYLRWFIRDDSTITVNGTGADSMGTGVVEVRYGTLNLNSDQTFSNNLILGSTSQGNGNSTVTIGAPNTVTLGSGISYNADSVIANTSTISGGTMQVTGANRTITVNDHPGVVATSPELTISSDLTDDNDLRDITIIGGGTLLLSGSNTHDRTVIQNQRVILGSGDAFGTGDGVAVSDGDGAVTLQQNNASSASVYDGAATLDINGQDVVFSENFQIGGSSNGNVAVLENLQVIDSVGTGKLILGGTNGSNTNNNIEYVNGGGTNLMATVSADIEIDGSTSTFSVQDGADDVDLLISGTITTDNGVRDLFKSNPGTLHLSATDNAYRIVTIQSGALRIEADGSLGTNDFQLGANTLSGTLEYVGVGGTIDNQTRIGDNNAAGTRVGGGTISNTGSGTLTFSQGTFNEARGSVTVARTLTLDGTSDIVISGAVVDNNTGGGGTVGVTKTGSNTVTLNGNNTYTGATTVSAGTLNINGTNTSAITVAAGANLDGEESTNGALVFSGATHTINADGLTAGALGSTTSTDVSALSVGGFIVNITGGGAGAFDVLTYGTTFTGALDRFVVGTSVPASGRGAAGFADSGSAITYDLGYESKTWEGTDVTNSTFWDINTTANWSGGSDALFFDGDSVTFGDGASDFNPTLQSNVTVGNATISAIIDTNDYTLSDNGGGETLTVNGTLTVLNQGTSAANDGIDVVVNNVIAGDGSVFIGNQNGVVDASQNSVRFNGANTFTGGLTVDEGRFIAGNDSAAGDGVITLSDTGTNRDPIFDFRDTITIANDFVISETGGGKVIRVDNFGAGAWTGTITGNITINETSTSNTQFNAGENDLLTVSGVVSGVGGFRKLNLGTFVLDNAANSFERGVWVDRGTVQVASIGDIGVNSHAGSNSTAEGLILGNNQNTGTIEYTGAVASTNRQVAVGDANVNANRTGAGSISNTGSGTLTFSNAAFNVARTGLDDTSDRILGFDGTSDIVVSGVIIDNTAVSGTAAIAVTKDGANTLTLSAANTYTGDTTVNAGTLSLGDGSGLADAADVVVATGAMLNLNYGGTDTIDELTVGGVARFSGTWGASGSGATFIDDAVFSGTGTLTVTTGPTPTVYDLWAGGHGLVGPAALVTADDEPDSLVNLLEFGFGMDPNAMDNLPLVADGSVNGTPLPVFTGGGGGVSFDLYFISRDDAGASGSVTYTVQFSADLVTFYDSAVTPVFVADSTDDPDYEVVKVPYPFVLPEGKARFARVKVTQVP